MNKAFNALCRSFLQNLRRIVTSQRLIDSQGQPSEAHAFRQQRGFTIIELLIIIAIIALLAAIAIPQFITYRNKSIDTQMKSDLRNAAVALESYFQTNGVYPSSAAVISTLGFQGTEGVALTLSNVTANSYQLTASKPGGTQASFIFDSDIGSIQ